MNTEDNRLTNLLGALALALADDMRDAVEARSGVAAGAPAALTTILAYPGQSLDALCKTLRLTPSGAGRLVDRLVAARLVERRPGISDHRLIALHLTRRGEKVAERLLASRKAALLRPLAPLTSGERSSLEQMLEKMLYAMTPDRERCDHICRLCEITACPQGICPVESAALDRERGSPPLRSSTEIATRRR